MWMDGDRECVAVEASREGPELVLRYSELVEGRRRESTLNYALAPFDLRAFRGESTTLFADEGEREVSLVRGRMNIGVALYFGDGEVLLGQRDLFFERSACEAVHAATLARAAYFRGHSVSVR